ncbi:hypothetical protein ACWY4P_22400 [Streptomyces sp. LZ34]
MIRTRKAIAALTIAAAATLGLAAQSTAFAVANDSHFPTVMTGSGDGSADSSATPLDSHFPLESSR